jgi:hypothetical protein
LEVLAKQRPNCKRNRRSVQLSLGRQTGMAYLGVPGVEPRLGACILRLGIGPNRTMSSPCTW